MMATDCLPADVAAKLDKFCGERKTGSLQLDIKDGRVLGWQFTESGRVRTNG